MSPVSIPLGPFEVYEPIGAGGMGEVWRGRHTGSGVPIAVKVLTTVAARDMEYVKSFEREVGAVAALDHVAIVTVYDYGVISRQAEEISQGALVSGSPYLVMELASGGTLGDLAEPLPWGKLKPALLEILDALAHAHARGVVHRDLKPANILIATAADGVTGLKLTDFGIAHAAGRSTMTGYDEVAGTPYYMAPELLISNWRDTGPWTDLYALGCMAYELATGSLPFDAANLMAIVQMHLGSPVPPLRPRHPVPPGFEPWISKLLEKDRFKRFRRAADAAWSLARLPDVPPPEAPFFPAPSVLMDDDDGDDATEAFDGDIMSLISQSVSDDDDDDEGDSTQYLAVDPSVLMADLRSGGGSEGSESEEDDPTMAVSTEDLGLFGFERDLDSTRVADALSPDVTAPDHAGDATRVADPDELLKAQRLSQSIAARTSGPARARRVSAVDIPAASKGPLTALGFDVETLETVEVALQKVEEAGYPPIPQTWRRPEPPRQWMKLLGAEKGLYGMRNIPLVAREVERDRIWSAFREVRHTGTTQVIVLHGAAGCGKTRLCHWVTERAHEVGSAIMLEATHDRVGGPAHGLSAMVARSLRCGRLPRTEVAERVTSFVAANPLDEHDLHDIEPLVDLIMEGSEGAGPLRSEQERHDIVARFLARLSRERTLLVTLDDAQWGADSIRFARYLLALQQHFPLPILVLVAVGVEAVSSRPAESQYLDEMLSMDGASLLEVPPLTDTEHNALIHRLLGLDDSTCTAVRERTLGNPLFAVQLVGDWVERSQLELGDDGFRLIDGASIGLPDAIHHRWLRLVEHILERFQAKTRDAAQQVLEMAAAMGQSVDTLEWETAASAAGLAVPAGLLDALEVSRIIERSNFGWSFVHPMLRESLQRQARETGRWIFYHEHCAQMLRARYAASQPGIVERLGRHLLEAGQLEDALAPLLNGADERRRAGDFTEAHDLFARRHQAAVALGIARSDPRCALGSLRQASAYASQGFIGEATRLIHAAREGANTIELRAELDWMSAVIAAKMGNTGEAVGAFQAAMNGYTQAGNSLGVANCWLGLGNMARSQGEYEISAQSLSKAYELFRRNGDLDALGECLAAQAMTVLRQGDGGRAGKLMRKAVSCYDRVSSALGRARCLAGLGDIARFDGKLDQAEAHYLEALQVAESVHAENLTLFRVNLGLVLLARAVFKGARKMLELCRIELEEAGRLGHLGRVHAALMPCEAAASDWTSYDRHAAAVHIHLSQDRVADPDIAWSAELAGEIAIKLGDPQRAVRAMEVAAEQWYACGQSSHGDRASTKLQALRR